MSKYYSDSLSGNRLKRCYDLAPPRVRQYLSKEIKVVRERIRPGDRVLELGCGYGRVLKELRSESELLVGIDNSVKSLLYGKRTYLKSDGALLICMDAGRLGFHDKIFDLVYCIQNGISALGIEPAVLIKETLRVTKPNGKLILSSYSDKFWDDRLKWFRIQAKHGLIGEIDYSKTKEGIIVCKDGFKATTFTSAQFKKLLSGTGKEYTLFEIDDSSLFCEIVS
jgi:ubiquinone/menaquinone biosynthesis C-methylase UbiE